MDNQETEALQGKTRKKELLPPLPFTYERTYDPKRACFKEWRMPGVYSIGQERKPRTDSEILELVRKEQESREWFYADDWREKGIPSEQIEFLIGEHPITVYNFNSDVSFTDEHIEKLTDVLKRLTSHFPSVVEKIRWILIEDEQIPSSLGDPELYPANGWAGKPWGVFVLYPRGLEVFPYRVAKVSNFEGVLAHELTHLTTDDFRKEWEEKFKWEACADYKDNWELRRSLDGTQDVHHNKQTGEFAPSHRFPLQPEQCVTYYARLDWDEDVCESVVAYLYDPELLKRVSPEKFAILEKHDVKEASPQVSSRRVSKGEITLPEIKPETIYYYVEEPEGNGTLRKWPTSR